MTQIGGVSTTRFFGSQRGKALAIVGLGFSFALALFPMTLAHLIARIGWQQTLMLMAASVVVSVPAQQPRPDQEDGPLSAPPRTLRRSFDRG